jgi:O-acetyl-ADP-ribose deacetylase (regulator of RNase III)
MNQIESTRINATTLEITRGNIIDQEVDAIVNAANSALAGGGGVDGVIHRAGGPAIMAELNEIKMRQRGCPTGSAVVTGAGNLRATYVIHAVGPIYRGGNSGEPELLASAYRTSLQLADEFNAKSVAFPSISTGAYGYPIRDAAEIAMQAVSGFCEGATAIQLIRFVLFDHQAYSAFAGCLKRGR